MNELKQIALDVTNQCSKACSFCYNRSHVLGNTIWNADEVIALALDCHAHGVEAFSLGGGEPTECPWLFEVIDHIKDELYVTVTSNGLKLTEETYLEEFSHHLPDKIHISIHNPDNQNEVERVIRTLCRIRLFPVKVGVNLLTSSQNVMASRNVYRQLLATGFFPDSIILLPMKYSNCPSAKDISFITGGKPFQAPSCLMGCKRPKAYCSISWNKIVKPCSYTPSGAPLEENSYQGVIHALASCQFVPCQKQ